MFNKTFLLLTLVATASIHAHPDKPLDMNTMPRYVEHYINALFDTHRDQPREVREFITHIKNNTIDSAAANCADLWFIFPTGTFNTGCVEHVIRTEALNKVVETARTIAYGFTHDEATLAYIEKTIRDEILKYFTGNDNVNGALKGYCGETLKNRIWTLKKQFDAQKRSAYVTHYPSDECCICLDAFNNEVRQVFLNPCGHDICADCATNWFFEQNKNSCPHPYCRSDVSKSELRKALRGR